MRNKKEYVISSLIFLVLIFGGVFLIQPVVANGSTIEYVANDSYIDSSSPNENYGDATILYVMSGANTYLHFDFHNKPDYVDYAILKFVVISSSGYIYVDLVSYEDSFNESEITYNNIDLYSETGSGEILISYVDGDFIEYYSVEYLFTIPDDRTELTFEFSVQEALDCAFIVSKEGAIEIYDFPKQKPQIEWFEGEPPINQAPTATIDSITPIKATQGADTVSFSGSGSDTDGTIIAYEWSSSKDGVLSSLSSFNKSADDLSIGQHRIYFRVKDDDGNWSNKVSKVLTIEEVLDGNGDENGNGEPEPEFEIAGFNLLILLGIIGVATPILIKKIKKRQ